MALARLFFLALTVSLAGCQGLTSPNSGSAPSAGEKPPPASRPAEHATVVWISVDGLRGDYVARVRPPFLSQMVNDGCSTDALVPIFPSLTFPSHLSEATGAAAGVHGITGNAFYDRENRIAYSFPDDASVLQAEPIWLTAQRQGVRTAVVDWPMSQRQSGLVRSSFFNASYDAALSDADRIARLVQVYADDAAKPRLRLLMGYVHAVDTAGHRFGPDSPLVDSALRETDGLLQKVVADLRQSFDRDAGPEDALYVLISTDHGMVPVRMVAHLETLLGDAKPEAARIVVSGSTAQIYLDDVPEADRAPAVVRICERLTPLDYLHVWPRAKLPFAFNFDHPARTGDVVVACKPGYTLSTQPGPTRPALPADVKGMHGYDPAECDEVLGFAALARYPSRASADRPAKTPQHLSWGRVSSLRLHATVASLLQIEPAATAQKDVLPVPEP